jgi:NAD(P)H-dependent FMN reductase
MPALNSLDKEIGGETLTKPTLQIIVASTRPGRLGPTVANWIQERALLHGGFDVEIADLAEINLPFMDEPNNPNERQYIHQHTWDWSRQIEAADALVVVMPEYNNGFNAPLKNAIDYLYWEWQYKSVGFVGYGGASGGSSAVQMIKHVVTSLKMVPVPDAVSIPFVWQLFDDHGTLHADGRMNRAATAMLDELAVLTDALHPLRVLRSPAA